MEQLKIFEMDLVQYPLPHHTIEVLSPERSFMLETQVYIRKPFKIQAAQVNSENIHEVAKWVKGEVRTDDIGQYIKVRVHRPLNDRQTKAYLTDWVLYAGTGFKCYNDAAFKKSFELVSGETVMVDIVDGEAVEKESEIVGVVEGDIIVPKRVAKKAPAKKAVNA